MLSLIVTSFASTKMPTFLFTIETHTIIALTLRAFASAGTYLF